MAGLVDHAALILDLRGALRERASWGRGQILGLIDDLEQQHRIDETADAAVLRRYCEHLLDTSLGILPAATSDPLPFDDRLATSAAMDEGATSDSHGGNACRPTPPRPSQRSPRGIPSLT